MDVFVGSEDLYSILGLPQRGTAECKKLRPEDITRAYRRKALECHPDVCASEEAISMFQKVSAAYNILRQPNERAQYDKNGCINPANTSRANTTRQEDWMEAFREMYKEVSKDEVAEFFKKYIGSDEEKEDVVKYYNATKGDFITMMQAHCMFPNDSTGHVERIRALVCQLIEDGELTLTKRFTSTSSSQAIKDLEDFFLEEREKAALEEQTIVQEAQSGASARKSRSKSAANSQTDLQLAVFANERKFEDFLNVLEGKYTEAGKAAKKPRKQK